MHYGKDYICGADYVTLKLLGWIIFIIKYDNGL